MKRMLAVMIVGCCCLSGLPRTVQAQQHATTVQLPTFSFFSVSTTVLAPDSGRGYMGGLARAGTVRPKFGHPLVRNHSMGNFRNAAGVSVAVQVHDMRWMDEMLLGRVTIVHPQPDERGMAARSEFAQQLANESAASSAAANYGSMHVNDIRRAKEAKQAAKNVEAGQFVAKAEEKRKEGKLALAKHYLQRAASKASGELLDVIKALIRDYSYAEQQAKSGGGD